MWTTPIQLTRISMSRKHEPSLPAASRTWLDAGDPRTPRCACHLRKKQSVSVRLVAAATRLVYYVCIDRLIVMCVCRLESTYPTLGFAMLYYVEDNCWRWRWIIMTDHHVEWVLPRRHARWRYVTKAKISDAQAQHILKISFISRRGYLKKYLLK